MKTLIKFMAIAASFAALASCTKELSEASDQTDSASGKSKEGYVQYSFGISCEGETNYNAEQDQPKQLADTKTTISDDLKVSWEEGKDSVLVIWGTTSDDTAHVAVKQGSLTFDAPGEVETFYAVYPYTAATTLAEDQLSVTLPQKVDGSWRQAGYMAAKSTATDKQFDFKFICSAVKFEITDTLTTTMRIRGNVNEGVTGTVTFSFDDDNAPTDFTASATKTEVYTGAVEKGSLVYLPMLPEVSLPYGFAIRKTVDGTLTAALSTGALTTERGDIVNLGQIQNKVKRNYFIKQTATGTGDGSSWDNAGDASLIVKLFSPYIYGKDGTRLGDNQKFAGTTNAWRLHQSFIFIAAGTYDIKDGSDVSLAWNFAADPNFTVRGGYPADATGKDVSVRDIDANVTTLTTSATGTNVRLFYANACYLRTVKFDGLYFSVPNGNSGRGFILYQNSTGTTNKMSNGNACINFIDCRVKNSNHANYGLININNRWSKVNVTGCVFESNTTSHTNGGAAICVDGCKNMTIEDCIFKGNSAVSGGGAISLKLTDEEAQNGAATVNISHCRFSDNSVTACDANNRGRGGAINILGNSTIVPVVNIDSCTFADNSARSTGGAIGFNYCTLTVDSCTFSGNTAAGYYATSSQAGNLGGCAISGVYNKTSSSSVQSYANIGIVTIKNSIFDKNGNYGRGGAAQFGTETVYIDNCVFSGNKNTSNGGGALFFNNTQAYISNCVFDGNYATNDKGGAICLKASSSNTYLFNNIFKGNYGSDGNAVAAFDNSSQTAVGVKVYLYGNTFFNNGTAKSAVYCPKFTTMYVVNNTFCEESTADVITAAGGLADPITFYNNIIVGDSNLSVKGSAAVSMISQGKNIYHTLTNVTLTEDVGDVEGKTVSDVFGTSTPELDANNKLPWEGGIVSEYAAASDVKAAIQTASTAFYTWLDSNNYWFSGSSWWPGAYQSAE